MTLSPSHTLPRAHPGVWRVASPQPHHHLPTVARRTFIVKAEGLSHFSVSLKPHLWLPQCCSHDPSLWFRNLLRKCGLWPVFCPQLSARLSLHFPSKFSLLPNLSTSLLSIAPTVRPHRLRHTRRFYLHLSPASLTDARFLRRA